MNTHSIPKPAHPRPDKMRESWKNLNGEWDFSFDEPIYDRKIIVPFSWASPLSKIGENKKATAYYRKKTSFDGGENDVYLVIGACDYEADVYVNGTHLAYHRGGYMPIEVNLSSVWKNDEENTIEVKATDVDYPYAPKGKQSYGQIRGIWQTVYLETRPKVHIESFFIRTLINGKITIGYTLSGGEGVVRADFEDAHGVGDDGFIFFSVDNPKLWSPDTPYLYHGTISVESEYGVDTVHTYFGIREIGSARFSPDGEMYVTLNGKPIYVNSVLDQSFNLDGYFTLPTNEEEEEEILRLKRVGLNGARIHIKAEEPRKLYFADLHGLLLMQDMPCMFPKMTPEARAEFELQMHDLMRRDINHPSIFQWILFNEDWGLATATQVPIPGTNQTRKRSEMKPQEAEWVRRCYHIAKYIDPTRLVEDHSPARRDHVESDINTWHFYSNGYTVVKERISSFIQNTNDDPFFNYAYGNRRKDVPLMNSECGNVWGITGTAGDSDISYHYKYMLNEFRLHEKICGYVFTQFHDVTNEFNGFYRINNVPKRFGYEEYVPGMSVSDLHSQDFLAIDAPPAKTCIPRERVCVPVYISSFTDENHNADMTVKWELVAKTYDCREEVIDSGSYNFRYSRFGTTKVFNLFTSMPDFDSLCTLRLWLCRNDDVIMRNFAVFDVCSALEGVYCVPLSSLTSEGFDYTKACQKGEKLNFIGSGKVSFELPVDKLPVGENGIKIFFEASSRPLFAKDKLKDGEEIPRISAVSDYRPDRTLNRNSFPMTDDELSPSRISCICGDTKTDITLSDCPADSRGVLSHLYQAYTTLLDEAGSYGYLCSFDIPSKELAGKSKISVTLQSDDGFSVFGRKSGRFPVGIYVVPSEKNNE